MGANNERARGWAGEGEEKKEKLVRKYNIIRMDIIGGVGGDQNAEGRCAHESSINAQARTPAQ